MSDSQSVLAERPQRHGDELGSIVAPQYLRRAVAECECFLQGGDETLAGMDLAAMLSTDLSGVCVVHRPDLEFPPVRRRI
ncbi:hypothetical protein H351_30765 (plasmid) [Rhodococcus erythropolis R138]|nr:hypothetical protein H351_30765 [Rhodococcus erythropolis R138]